MPSKTSCKAKWVSWRCSSRWSLVYPPKSKNLLKLQRRRSRSHQKWNLRTAKILKKTNRCSILSTNKFMTSMFTFHSFTFCWMTFRQCKISKILRKCANQVIPKKIKTNLHLKKSQSHIKILNKYRKTF